MLTAAFTGTLSKLFLKLGCSEVKVVGLPLLLDALSEENRVGRGLITVSNHISVLDDPLVWGILPWHHYFSSKKTRWTLGASDIIFTNSVFSHFLRRGQVIETFRGDGIHQKAVDLSVEKLNTGGWIHIFPEGKVNQVKSNPNGGLLRFKWGVSHMMIKANQTPLVIPMYLEGFDDIMPADRGFPRFMPRVGKRLKITFGDPSGVTEEVQARQETWRAERMADDRLALSENNSDPEARLRILMADILQQAVKRLGDDVTGSKAY